MKLTLVRNLDCTTSITVCINLKLDVERKWKGKLKNENTINRMAHKVRLMVIEGQWSLDSGRVCVCVCWMEGKWIADLESSVACRRFKIEEENKIYDICIWLSVCKCACMCGQVKHENRTKIDTNQNMNTNANSIKNDVSLIKWIEDWYESIWWKKSKSNTIRTRLSNTKFTQVIKVDENRWMRRRGGEKSVGKFNRPKGLRRRSGTKIKKKKKNLKRKTRRRQFWKMTKECESNEWVRAKNRESKTNVTIIEKRI